MSTIVLLQVRDTTVLIIDDSWRMGRLVQPEAINTIAKHLGSTCSSPPSLRGCCTQHVVGSWRESSEPERPHMGQSLPGSQERMADLRNLSTHVHSVSHQRFVHLINYCFALAASYHTFITSLLLLSFWIIQSSLPSTLIALSQHGLGLLPIQISGTTLLHHNNAWYIYLCT